MSLNGLEAAEVIEAYQSALNEGGGWFLLKYHTRDEVGLLERGKGGVAEIQEAVHGYEEESPLYGFIHYRRRKVVLKYVPEGTSRLLLARLAVHFEFIKERFTPYDTIFTFAEAYELSDSTLSSTCSLHTAASIKSLRDSPTRNLAGVKEEDVSESGTVRSPGSEAGTIRNSKVEPNINEQVRPTEEASPRLDDDSVPHPMTNGPSSPSKTSERPSSSTSQGLRPRTASNTHKDLPPTPGFSSPYMSEKPGSIYDHGEFGPRSSIDTRISSNSVRPSTRDLNRAYDYNRPKIKVGPRPSMESTTRPDTANGGDHGFRPVASLPSGVRMPARKAVTPRPNSQQSQKKFSLQIPKIPSQGSTPAPPPVTPTNPTHSSDKRPLVSNNGLTSPGKTADTKSPKMTPEKRRLMKALQIRQKHLAAQTAAKGLGNDAILETQDERKPEDGSPALNVTEASPVEATQESLAPELQSKDLRPKVPQPEDREAAKESHEVQDSPISAPEPSDGPSTQASSITEEENPVVHKHDEPEATIPPNGYENTPGLQNSIREQTQGPIIAIEQDARELPKEIIEPPVTVTPGSEEEKPALPIQNQSNIKVEGDAIRDSAKTTSIVSEPSSEHTMTDKQTPLLVEPAVPAENAPRIHAAETSTQEDSKSTNLSTPIPFHEPSENFKEAFEEVSVMMDTEEPESPFLIEGHSVQTSASPSVVNLLDGLSATTHNESTLPAHDVEVVAPIQALQPSLFNMVGGFGDSGESIEKPLSAVREEAEIAPSPSQSDTQLLHSERLPRKTEMPKVSSTEEDGQTSNVNEKSPTIEQPRTPVAESAGETVETSPPDFPAAQKTRPRTTSKTFQFPSNSRSLSRGERPPSLELPRDTKHTQESSAEQLPLIPGIPATDRQSNLKVEEDREVQLRVQPEGQPESQSAVSPVPDALSHASSKALKLLGFSAPPSEVRTDTHAQELAESTLEMPIDPLKEALAKEEVGAESEALPSVKLDLEVDKEHQQELLLEARSEGLLDIQPDVQPPSQSQPSMADSFASNITEAIEEDKQIDRQARRRGIVEPVKRVSTPEQSDEHFLSDDSFMEELKSATVQEAKPISVSRSPIKPGFLGSENDPKVSETRDSRIVSSPFDPGNGGERRFSSSRPSAAVSLRSFSGTILPRPDVKTPPGPQSAQPKKFGVSSGISQRIKALENKSSRPGSPNLPTPTTPGFLNLRKPSFNSELNGALAKNRTSTAYPSPQTSPEIGKPDPLHRSAKPRGETVSVTATIIRHPTDRSPRAPHDAANPPTLNLHESPLIVEHQVMGPPKHQVMGPPQFSPLKPPRPRYSRYSSARSASSSSTEHKADGRPHSRRGSTASKRSGMSSRNGSEVDLPRALSDRSLNSSSPLDGIKEEKKGSRSSRLLKRMSSVTSISRRSIAQAINPSPKAGSIMEREEPIVEKPAFSAIDIGDINIQFPDTLLWKRRHVTINEGGVLELMASKADNNSKIITKRYPLSDFRPPYIPDQDRQELPNSIILDFNDGSSLQCACEHPSAQAHLLKVLKFAHSGLQWQ